MANQDTQNKIYYDVNINFNPTEADNRHHFFSKAQTEIRLNGPLITDPMNYDLAISKFKIDTECVPVFIPEMAQPQIIPGGAAIDKGERNTTYKVWLYYPSYVAGNPVYEGKYTRIEQIVTVVANNGWGETTYQAFSLQHKLPYITNGADNYAQNTDPDYFFFDYQTFLDRINVAIERAFLTVPEWAGAAPAGADEPVENPDRHKFIRAAFFKVADGKIEFHVSREIIEKRYLIRFSANLYKYIGNGFKCRFYDNPNGRHVGAADVEKSDGSFFIDINPFVWRHLPILVAPGAVPDADLSTIITRREYYGATGVVGNDADYVETECDSKYTIEKNHGAGPVTMMYYVFKQQYSSLCNWNACKAILICSSSFPIKAEYYPTNKKNIFLTHYKEPWYINLVRRLYGDDATDDRAIFDKASTKILDVYYPLSSTAGDIRSTIIYDNQDIESGNKIDMIGGMDLENFDIIIKWVDIYGNVYDLYLAPGSSVNIRLCFTRKKIRKDELEAAFGRVSDSLDILTAGKVPQEDNSKTFDLKMEPRRKRNKVELPGVLENGMIMKP